MPEDDVSSENIAPRSRANDAGISQDDVSARVKQPRQVDISDFLRRKYINAESAEQSYDLRSKASVTESTTATQHSTTNDDEDDAFCSSSSSEEESSPLSPEMPTPVKNKDGKKAPTRKNKGKNTSKKRWK